MFKAFKSRQVLDSILAESLGDMVELNNVNIYNTKARLAHCNVLG